MRRPPTLRGRDQRWRLPGEPDRQPPAPKALAVGLVLASLALMTLDRGHDSPIDPARSAVADVVGPMETGAATVTRPLVELPGWLHSQRTMRDHIDTLQAENARLRAQLATSPYEKNRLAEYDALSVSAQDLGRTLVPAHVVAMGPSQSFSDTVTIDAGSAAGVQPGQTVLNNDGLVGRVLRASRHTATVLLVIDPESTVGGRVGSSMQIGFLHGRGSMAADDELDLDLVDETAVPQKGDAVVTWGSQGGAPYVAGIPVGTVTHVYSSLRETSQRAVIKPFVHFSELDLVGVVVPTGTTSDRRLVQASGEDR